MNYHKTYSDLTELIGNIFLDINGYLNPQQRLIIKRLEESFNNELRFLIGVYFFEINTLHALEIFKSNRYFIDAVGIKLLPSFEKIDLLTKKFQNDNTLEYLLKEIINSITNHSNKEQLSKFKLTSSQIHFLDEQGYLIIENVIPI